MMSDEDYYVFDAHGDDDADCQVLLGINNIMMMMISLSMVVLLFMFEGKRDPSIFDQRLNWEKFTTTHSRRKEFRRHLRMSRKSFELLLSYIKDDLQADEKMAALRGGVIIPELRLYATLRYLAGGSYSDIYFFTGISRASFYRVVWQTIQAINRCEQLKIRLPKTSAECARAAAGFERISFMGCIKHCVYVVDGYLMRMTTPTKKEAGNVRSYFSGHYQHYGVNIQAACDHLCRFVFLAVAAPGVTGDREALEECLLHEFIEALPGLFTAIGDCAYKPTEHMAPIYRASDARNRKYDAFNFYASQLRIRIEMAFGLMTKKWGILSRPISIKLKNVKFLITAIAQLHNFCINERLKEQADVEMGQLNFNARDVELDIYERALREEAAEIECVSDEFPGWSLNRQRMSNDIASMHLSRPPGSRGTGVVNGQLENDSEINIDVV
jgi:DDE superfamily endonuclease